MININNIKNVINFISSIKDIEKSIVNPVCGCKYFRGDGDLIINDYIIDFKVSKNDNFSIKEFSQLILYSFGLYINNKSQDRELDVFKYKELRQC
jgi:hypothetical protein